MIELQYGCEAPDMPEAQALRQWLEAAAGMAGAHGEILVRIVSPEESAELNHRYRDRDRPTNVLSFPFTAPEGLPPEALPAQLGDLVICAEVVAREAREYERTPEAHWAHMLVHGLLHLLGHDHQQTDEAARMEALESRIMEQLGFADPWRSEQEDTEHHG